MQINKFRICMYDGKENWVMDVEDVDSIVVRDGYTMLYNNGRVKSAVKTNIISGIFNVSYCPGGFKKENNEDSSK